MKLQVFYINLDRDLDRKQHMEDMLSELGFDYVRVPATEGVKINIADYYDDQLARERNGTSLTAPEVGCAASHREIYRRIVQERIPYALVFEDDVTVIKQFRQIIEQIIDENTRHQYWEYLTFDYAESGSIFLKRWFDSVFLYYQRQLKERGLLSRLAYLATAAIKLVYLIPLTYFESMRNHYYKQRHLGKAVIFWRPLYFAGCYLVSLEGAKKLLKLSEPRIIYPADRLPNQARLLENLRFRAYAPIVAKQLRRRFGSSIGVSENFDHTYKETEL